MSALSDHDNTGLQPAQASLRTRLTAFSQPW